MAYERVPSNSRRRYITTRYYGTARCVAANSAELEAIPEASEEVMEMLAGKENVEAEAEAEAEEPEQQEES